MVVKIRLKRIGKTNSAFYRIVAVDHRARRDGAVLEELGWYKPVAQPKLSELKTDRIKYWLSTGAQLTDGTKLLFDTQGLVAKAKVEGPKAGAKRRKADKLTKSEKRSQAQAMVESGDAKAEAKAEAAAEA